MRKKKQRTPEEQLEAAKVPREEWPYELPEGWTWVRLLSTFENQTDSKKKLKTKECLPAGKFPVIDQGKDFISGYTDREELVRSDDFPVVIFGDHTRYVKYVDFPFVQGADGIKVLKPAPLVDSRFFYYGLQTLPLPHLGYRRHFPLFKKFAFPLPPLAEQHRIVQRIESLFAKLDEAEEKLDAADESFEARKEAMLQAAFRGRLTESWRQHQGENADKSSELIQKIEEQKEECIKSGTLKKQRRTKELSQEEKLFEVPSSWSWVRIGRVFTLQAGKNVKASEIYETGAYRCYGGNGLRGYVNSINRDGTYPIIGRQGALCGNVHYVVGKFYATEHAVTVETYQSNPKWAAYFLQARNLNQFARAMAQPGLAVSNINQVSLPLPPLDEQREIVRILDRLLARERRAKEAVAAARTHLKKLRASILARAFRGEL